MASSVFAKIRTELTEALKSGDEVTVSTLRFLISKLDNAKIAKGGELTDEEALGEIEKDAKRHRESIEAYEAGDRRELAEKERKELAVLEKYLPEKMSENEISKVVDEVISQFSASGQGDIGKVIGQVMGQLKGKADGGVVSALVKEKLGG